MTDSGNTPAFDKLAMTGKICAFIRSIGIPVETGKVSADSFLPDVEIVGGKIIYDADTLKYPGDLLHEAGHIALIPANLRDQVTGNVVENHLTDGGEEVAVMLWTYAACLFAGIPPEVVFHPDGYRGQSQWLLNNYRSGVYIGLPLLQWMKLCSTNQTEGFPSMLKWLRD